MLPAPSCAFRFWIVPALAWTAGSFAACATGSPEDSAKPPPADGGFSGADGGADDGADGNVGGSGGSGGTNTGGTGGTGGTPPPGSQCETCSDDAPCDEGFTCVTSPVGHPFCAGDCDGSACPAGGYECVDLAGYDDGASGQGCVPTDGESCACTSALEGQGRPCSNTNTLGTCPGEEKCTSGSWGGCDAPAAEAEICDGADNNCNGSVDMDEPGMTGNDLCAAGSAPPHSGFTCVGGKCELAGCDPGWARYPANLPVTAGCACPVDTGDVDPATNGECTTATSVGDLPDEGGSPLLIEGTLHSDTDEDWYAINAVDKNQVPAFNTYRVHIEFLQPNGNPGDEYLFDVIRGTVAEPCSAAKTSLTSYDWCADSTTTPAQPADDDQGAPYRLRVYRNPAATGTCNAYKIRVTNGGSGACPAADACGAT